MGTGDTKCKEVLDKIRHYVRRENYDNVSCNLNNMKTVVVY